MKLNMGPLDRKIRLLVVAPVLVVAGLLLGPGGLLSAILYVLAGVMTATSAVGSCPLYSVFGLRTAPVSRTTSAPTKVH